MPPAATITATHHAAILRAASPAFQAFAWEDWTRDGDSMVSPSGKKRLSLPVYNRLRSRAEAKSGNARTPAPRPPSLDAARAEFRTADAELQAAKAGSEHAAALDRYRRAEALMSAAQLAHRQKVMADAVAAGVIPAVRPPREPSPPNVHLQQIAAVKGAARAAVRGVQAVKRGGVDLERRGGKAVSELLYGVTKVMDYVQEGVNRNFPRVAALADWLATASVPGSRLLPGGVPIIPGDAVRNYHRLLSIASVAARQSGAFGAAMRVASNAYGYFNDEYRANKKRWGAWPARVIEAAAFLAHKFVTPVVTGAVVGGAIGGLATGGVGFVPGALVGAKWGLGAGVASLGVPEIVSTPMTGGLGPVVKKGWRAGLDAAAAAVLGPGKATKEATKGQTAKMARDPLAWARRQRHAAAKQAADARRKNPFSLNPFSEQAPEPLTVTKLIAAVRARVGGPVPAGVVLAALAVVAGDGAGVEKFAWKTGKKGGRYWLPDGRQDVPGNRLYGRAGQKAAAAANATKPAEPPKPRPSPAAAPNPVPDLPVLSDAELADLLVNPPLVARATQIVAQTDADLTAARAGSDVDARMAALARVDKANAVAAEARRREQAAPPKPKAPRDPSKPIGSDTGKPPTWQDVAAEVVVQFAAKLAGLGTAAVTYPLALGYGAAIGPILPAVAPLMVTGGGDALFESIFSPFQGLLSAPYHAHQSVKRNLRASVGGIPDKYAEQLPAGGLVAAIRDRLTYLAAQAGKPLPPIPDAAIRTALARAMVAVRRQSKPGGAFEAFAWSAQQTRRGTIKAVGTGEHAGRVAYGKKAQQLLTAKPKGRAATTESKAAPPQATSAPKPSRPPADPTLTPLARLSNLAGSTVAGLAVTAAAAKFEGAFKPRSQSQRDVKEHRLWTAAYRANKKRYGTLPAMAIEAVAWTLHHGRETLTPYAASMGAGMATMAGASLAGAAVGGPLGGAVGLPVGAFLGAQAAARLLGWFQDTRTPGPSVAERRKGIERELRPLVYMRVPATFTGAKSVVSKPAAPTKPAPAPFLAGAPKYRPHAEAAPPVDELVRAVKLQVKLAGGDVSKVPDAEIAAALSRVAGHLERSLAA